MFKCLKIQEHVRTKHKICEIGLICDGILIGLNFVKTKLYKIIFCY